MPTIISKDTIVILHQLHPPSNLVPPPIFNYQPKHTFILDKIIFAQALTIIPLFFFNEFSRMVYEHFLRCFIPKDPSSWFSELFQVGDVVAHGDTLRLLALVPGVNRLLIKDTNSFHTIAMGEVFIQLIVRSMVL